MNDFSEEQRREKKNIPVAPVCFKKSQSKPALPAKFGGGGAFTPILVGVVQTTTTTVTPAVRSPPTLPIGTFAKSTTTTTTTSTHSGAFSGESNSSNPCCFCTIACSYFLLY